MQFRKTKTFGGLRFSLGKKGLGVSLGAGPLRVGVGSDGKVRRTVRVPGTGVYDTKVIGEVAAEQSSEPDVTTMAFEGDDAPAATRSQRAFVKASLRGKVAAMPDLSELTVGQAEQILHAVGVDPAELYRSGRMPANSEEQAPWAARFGCD